MMDEIDLILVMSINPGFGGQKFMHSQLRKIEALRKMIDASGKHIELEVDGGVTLETAPLCVAAGATALVAGTAVFKGGPAKYADNIRALKGGDRVAGAPPAISDHPAALWGQALLHGLLAQARQDWAGSPPCTGALLARPRPEGLAASGPQDLRPPMPRSAAASWPDAMSFPA